MTTVFRRHGPCLLVARRWAAPGLTHVPPLLSKAGILSQDLLCNHQRTFKRTHPQPLNANLCGEVRGTCILCTLHRRTWGGPQLRVPAPPLPDDRWGWLEKRMQPGQWEGGGKSEFLWSSGGSLQDRRRLVLLSFLISPGRWLAWCLHGGVWN